MSGFTMRGTRRRGWPRNAPKKPPTLAIPRGLEVEKLGVEAGLLQQFLVRPLFDQVALLKHQDPVRHPDGGEAMRDKNRYAIPGELGEPEKDFVLRAGIECRGR